MSVTLKKWPPAKTPEERIVELTADIDSVTSYRLLNGFQWAPPRRSLPAQLQEIYAADIDVPVFRFSTSITDQGNMTQTAIDAIGNVSAGNDAWSAAWRGWLNDKAYDLTFDLVAWNEFSTAYGISKKETLGLGWVHKAALEECTTVEEMDKKFSSFEYSTDELAAAKESAAAKL